MIRHMSSRPRSQLPARTAGALIARQFRYDLNHVVQNSRVKLWSPEERPRYDAFWRDVVERYERYARVLAIPDDEWAEWPGARNIARFAAGVIASDVFTIGYASIYFGRQRRTIWNIVSANRLRFGKPTYRRTAFHPRRIRVMSVQDMALLASFLPSPSPSLVLLEQRVKEAFLKHYGIDPPAKRLFAFDRARF